MPKSKNVKRHSDVILESLDSKLDLVVEMVGQNTEDIKVMKGKMENMGEDIENIKIDIEFIKNDLKKKVDVDQFAVLEKRVSLLEKKVR